MHINIRSASSLLVSALALSVSFATTTRAQQPPVQSAALPGPGVPQGPRLELSMARAVEMAIDVNLGMQSDRMNVDAASHGVAVARASFIPQFFSNVSRRAARSVPNDFTQGVLDITSETVNVSSGVNQILPLMGMRYGLAWNNSRNNQVGGNPNFNPFIDSQFSFNIIQPLWRGLMTDPTRGSLEASQRRRAIADVELQQQIVRLENRVQHAYLDLISAYQALRVADQNLEIRQGSLNNARARVAVGAAAPIDLISAEADVLANQEQVLVAQADIQTREDALRTLILDPKQPDYWQIQIVANETIQLAERRIDLDVAIKNAMQNRLDVTVLKRNLEIQDLNLRVTRDAMRPAVDLRLDYGTRGTGGTRVFYGDSFPPEVIDRQIRSYGSVLGDTFGAAYPTWSAGVSVSYPIGRSAAEASYAQQDVTRRQGDLALRELEIAVVQQVREAARRVENSFQRVRVTQAALQSSEQQLEAEQRRFAAGLSTTLELQVRQAQLGTARTAELNARIGYNRALIEFERVQKTQ